MRWIFTLCQSGSLACVGSETPVRQQTNRSFHRRTLATVALLPAVLVLILAELIGSSGASFVSRSHNTGSLFTSGAVSLTNSRGGEAVITATGLLPGSSATGELTLAARGNFNLVVTLRKGAITDQPASPALSQALTLSVERISGTAQVLWSGTMSNLPSVSLGQLTPGSSATYRFTVTFPVANAVAELQNTSTKMTLEFTGVAQ